MAEFWKFINKAATETEPENIELYIEGDIIPDDDVWFYEWLGLQSTSPNKFRNELKQYEGKELSIWIDSYGGDVFAATGMYVALMARKGVNNLKVIKAMSAATLPMMAGKSGIAPGGMVMIHDPLVGIRGFFNAPELKEYVKMLDEVKETIITAYQTKSNHSRAKIWQMMEDETYMSPKTAVKEGFVDEILFTDNKNNEENIANFSFARLSVLNSMSDSAKRFMTFKSKLLSDKPADKPIKSEDSIKIAKAKLDLELQLI